MAQSECFSCSKNFNTDESQHLSQAKLQFERDGINKVYYKTAENEPIHIIASEDFFKFIKPLYFKKGKTTKS